VTDLEFYCIDKYSQELLNMDVYTTQISPGVFSCKLRKFELPKVIVGDQLINTSIQFHAKITGDCFHIILPCKNRDKVFVNGKSLLHGQILVFAQHQEMFIQIPKNYPKHYILVVSSEELARYYGSENITILKEAVEYQNFSESIFVNSYQFLKNLRVIIEELLNHGCLLNFIAVMNAQETLMCLLCDLLELKNLTPNLPIIAQSRQLAIIGRALNYIHKSSTLNMTIPEVAKVSFCCVRSLEYSFKAILGMTPKQYLIKRRLQSIHLSLKEENGNTIATLVKMHGIVNQGRFAQDYFKFFNEYPSDTKKQSQVVDYS
jgi:AraC-like DNA-binding protein